MKIPVVLLMMLLLKQQIKMNVLNIHCQSSGLQPLPGNFFKRQGRMRSHDLFIQMVNESMRLTVNIAIIY